MLHKLLCLIAIALAASPAQAGGRNRCNHNGNFNANFNANFHHNGFVQTPFAVAVAVPVGRQTFVNYSASMGGNQVGYNYSANYGFQSGAPMQAPVQAPLQAQYQQQAAAPGYSLNYSYQAGYGNAQTANANPCPPCPACPPANPPAPAPAPPQPTPAPAPAPAPTLAPLSIVQQSCVKCHSGAEAKGGLDLTQPLTCEQKLAAINAVLTGKMPKDRQISQQERDATLLELSK